MSFKINYACTLEASRISNFFFSQRASEIPYSKIQKYSPDSSTSHDRSFIFGLDSIIKDSRYCYFIGTNRESDIISATLVLLNE